MKKKLLMLMMVSFTVLAAGCGKEESEEPAQPVAIESIEEPGQEKDSDIADNIDDTGKEAGSAEAADISDGKSTNTDEPAETEDSTEKSDISQTDPMREAYGSVLGTLYKTYTLPDGTNLGYDEIRELSLNNFAIYDLDQDGKEELIITWTTTYMAGMAGIVYGYDDASGTVRTELIEFPAQTFYDNGVVEVLLSHNHGLAGEIDDFWPYTFYKYDRGTDAYLCIAEVDAWNKEYYELDYDGKPFPDDMDVDGDGILYKVTIGNDEKLMDLEEYKNWQESVIEGAKKIEIPFVEMTEDNIQGK